MKSLAVLTLMALAAADDDSYKLEKFDINSLASDIGELKKFNDCLISKGPCTPLYETYRDRTMESVKEACRRCTPYQKHFAHHFFELLKTKLPDGYDLFQQVTDPENKYFEAMRTELKKYETL